MSRGNRHVELGLVLAALSGGVGCLYTAPVLSRAIDTGRGDDPSSSDPGSPGDGGAATDAAPPGDATSGVPEPPQHLVAVPGQAIGLSWEPASTGEPAVSYKVFIGSSAAGPFTLLGQQTATSLLVRGQAPGVTRFFHVTAVSAAGRESAPSQVVSATPLDGVGGLVGWITGSVTRDSATVEGAVVRLHVTDGRIVAEAQTDALGVFLMPAPAGVYPNLEAGLDEDDDGDAFGFGADPWGACLSFGGGFAPALRVDPGLPAVTCDIAISLQSGYSIQGSATADAGWPAGPLVVVATYGFGFYERHTRVAGDGSYVLSVPSMGSWDVTLFLDWNGNGARDVNEPVVTSGCYDFTTGACVRDLAIGAPSIISGTLSGRSGWSVQAAANGVNPAQVYSTAAPDGEGYAIQVPANQWYFVTAFRDLDDDGRVDYTDADHGGSLTTQYGPELVVEPSREGLSGTAPMSFVDFSFTAASSISGSIQPAGTYIVVARTAALTSVGVATSTTDGAFTIEVESDETYYVEAFVDENGNLTRDLIGEDVLLLGEALSTAGGPVSGRVIQRRLIQGRLSDLRDGLSPGMVEIVAAFQGVDGWAGQFSVGEPEVANYRRPAADGSFAIPVGAIVGSGDRTACDISCSGTSVSRYLDSGSDFDHQMEGNAMTARYHYPHRPIDGDDSAGTLLDTSTGDVTGIDF